MSCPTCDHTMHAWDEAGQVFVCPRCGTVRDSEGVQVPKLVSRITEFAGKLTEDHQDLIDHFERLGIRESIMVDSEMI